MITSSNHLTNGRTGNELFRYASLMGIAKKFNQELMLPHWESSRYFEGEYPSGTVTGNKFTETNFHYNEDFQRYLSHGNTDFNGYFQSEKYWSDNISEIKAALTFKEEFKKQSRKEYEFTKPTIAISIRRGDYVGNSNYYQLPISYYACAIFEYFPNYRDYNFIIFSDDISYCSVHFSALPNVYFSENRSPIEDLCFASQCDHFIIGNSTFHWWQAYIGENENTKVIRPAYLFDGHLKRLNDDKDFWPERWIKFDHVGKKLDLRDVTFTIPVHYDHHDRKQNLDLCLNHLDNNFSTNIIIGEQGGEKMNCGRGYEVFKMPMFHRTKMLNDMASYTESPIIFNWDCDIIIAPIQLYMAVEMLRNCSDMVFPYDGRFARMDRRQWYTEIRRTNDIGIVGNTQFKGMEPNAAISVGGAVGFVKEMFFKGGGENENFISYGAEDYCREYRFRKLGFKVDRVPGCLYHMNHWCGPNSGPSNPYFDKNEKEWQKVKSMSKEQLEDYIKTWRWLTD